MSSRDNIKMLVKRCPVAGRCRGLCEERLGLPCAGCLMPTQPRWWRPGKNSLGKGQKHLFKRGVRGKKSVQTALQTPR